MGRRTSILIAALAFLPLSGFCSSGVSSTAAQFLKIPLGVRAAAMGEAFTAVSDDASAILWNVAGLSQIDDPEINLLHASQWEGLNDEFLGFALPVSDDLTLGFGAAYDHLSSFNSTSDPSAETGSVSNLLLEGGVAKKFGSHLSVGLGLKFLHSNLAGLKASGYGVDAGAMVDLAGRLLTLGAAVQNVGRMGAMGDGGTEKLPTTYRGGLALRPLDKVNVRALLSVEGRGSVDGDPVLQTGAEIGLGPVQKCVLFRGGYQKSDVFKELGEDIGFSFGFGLRLSSLQIDYALIPYGSLGNTQRFSLTYRFLKSRGSGGDGKSVKVAVQSQLEDVKSGSVKAATFDIKPQARTGIKNWALDITDSKGMVVRRFTGKGVPPRSLMWDGKDAEGNVVTGGVFTTYQLRTIDKNGVQIVSTEPGVDLGGGEVDLRGMDPRVLAMRPESMGPEAERLARANPTPTPTPRPRLETPKMPSDVQPEGRRGAIRVPTILFAKDSSVLRGPYLPYLDEVVVLIRRYPQSKVYIEGHAADEGTAQEAVRLSQDRADAVLRYLVETRHVSSNYLYARGHGESAPQDTSGTAKAAANNRRVDIVIVTQ